MPNWCSTSLTVRGPEEEVKAFYNGLKIEPSEMNGMCPEIKIIETYLPCPEELRETQASFVYDEIPESWAESVKEGHWTQEDYDKRVADNEKLKKQQSENLAKYGAKDWYDWQVKHWGIKWGDCETHFDGEPVPTPYNDIYLLGGYFQTPWGSAGTAFRYISEKFPNCVFMLDSDEEAGFFAGVEMLQNGELVFEEFYEPCRYSDDEIDWDDEDEVEKYEQWKEEQEDKIHDLADDHLRATGFLPPLPPAPMPRVTSEKKSENKKPHFWK